MARTIGLGDIQPKFETRSARMLWERHTSCSLSLSLFVAGASCSSIVSASPLARLLAFAVPSPELVVRRRLLLLLVMDYVRFNELEKLDGSR